MTSAAVFFRGKSRKNSSMYWISRAPCWRPYCLMEYSTSPLLYPRLAEGPLLGAKRHDRIDAGGAAGGQVAGHEGDERQQRGGAGKRPRILRADAEEERRDELPGEQKAG